jgi:hypothetical protein
MAEPPTFWDKFNIFNSFIGSVVLVAIPLVIKVGADSIAQSLETGRIIQQLLSDLSSAEVKTRQDIALVALDAALPPPKTCWVLGLWGCRPREDVPDQVVDIAVIVLKELKTESTQAAEIIKRRRPETGGELVRQVVSQAAIAQVPSAVDAPIEPPTTGQAARTAEAAQVAADILTAPALTSSSPAPTPPDETRPPAADADLTGVRLVYIQYRTDKGQAEALKSLLEAQGVVVPGIEQINGIRENSIRYANTAEQRAAERLQRVLEQNSSVRFDQLIDLKTANYQAPRGQFEVWLSD